MATMDNPFLPYLIAAIVIIAILYFVPFIRRTLSVLIRLAIFIAAVAIAFGGVSMLLNNETIFEKPGPELRVIRFATVNSARTTDSGTGAALCDPNAPPISKAAEAAMLKEAAEKAAAARQLAAAAQASPAAGASPGAKPSAVSTPSAEGEAPPDDDYPELMRRSFPGIPRAKLFDLSKDVVNSLGGWKIVKEDPRAGTLDCIYTSRFLASEDDVKITIMPDGQVDLCSRSGTARPDSTSLMRIFPGDLGANVGHIKQFYETLEPKMDEVYKEEQDKENAKKPH
jgi:Protein of unknown function (DUF1499)